MNYTIDHIPRSTPCDRRPGIPMTPKYITIHNTGNPSSTARNERAWLINASNTRQASFHIVVDEREAIECIPLNEVAWHAGDGGTGPGNRTSIGLEFCESGDYAKTLDNAATLVARLLSERGWGVDRLRRHFDWSGKICPRLMYDDGRWTGWTAFLNMVEYKMRQVQNAVDKRIEELEKQLAALQEENRRLAQRMEALEKLQSMAEIPEWAREAVEAFTKTKACDCSGPLVANPEGGSYDFYRFLTILYRAGIGRKA